MKRLILFTSLLLGLALVAPLAAQAGFGFSHFRVAFEEEDSSAALRAGSHPFAMSTDFAFNTAEEGGLPFPDEGARDVIVTTPPGFVGDVTAVPTCSSTEFIEISHVTDLPACSNATAIGYISLELSSNEGIAYKTAPVYNLTPSPGEVNKFGFSILANPVIVDVRLSHTFPYEPIATSAGITQQLNFDAARLTLWGNPSDPAHNPYRGACLSTTATPHFGELISNGNCAPGGAKRPFLTLPRTCRGPLSVGYEADSWQHPGSFVAGTVQPEGEPYGCENLAFNPTIEAKPTTLAANSPTGLDFSLDVKDEGLTNPTGLAHADIEKAVVTLPEGFTTNPSIAEGLTTCSEADLARETVGSAPGEGCPQESKIGTVEVESPLIGESVDGSLFVATPYENPFGTLLALYIVVRNPTLGIIVKQPLRVDFDQATGQITTTAEEIPPLPFSHFKLHFREGTRSPLASPPTCGTYAARAVLTPDSGAAPIITSSMFQIISGPEAGPCPTGGTPPFHPGLTAGTINNRAGSYSPFYVRLSRTDSEQEITHFSIKLPPGVTGRLAGIPFCPETDIAAARSRERTPHGGQEELEHPSCPQASEIGHTLAGAGVGPALTYVPGKVYLAGPFNGSNLSIVAITAARAGPFDLGTVVVHEALKVDPETAEVSVDAAGSDPIPHIVNGIPVHLRDIRVYVDRPEFVLNPTNCKPTSTASTVLGSGTDFASEADDRPVTVTTRFQAADCASLGFKPGLKLSLSGPTRRAGLPRLKAVVTPRKGDANIGRTVVTLPQSEFLEQGHIGTVCTRVQFNAGGGNGEQCPEKSIYGHAAAITPLLSEPLEGPVYLRSNGGERQLPDLVAALHSADIDIDLVGFINSLHQKGSDVSRIRNTFAAVPDAPVTKFTLEMFGGKKGLLVNSTNLCKGTHKAISEFTGQNGVRYDTEPAVQAQCKKKGKGAENKKGAKKSKAESRPALTILHRVAW
jgi:hypothetical protein